MTAASATARYLLRNAYLAYFLARDRRVPWIARGVAAGAVVYVAAPMDPIPDFFPVFGFLDDLAVLLLGFWLARHLVPSQLIGEHQAAIDRLFRENAPAANRERAEYAVAPDANIPSPPPAPEPESPERHLVSARHDLREVLLFPKLRPRSPVAVESMPLLARLLARHGDKPRGARRLALKLTRGAFKAIHRRLELRAPGQLTLARGDGPRRFVGDFSNTALIEYARLSAGAGYEPAVTALIDAVAPRARVAYDVGANWGFYVALLGSNAEFRGLIHAFEIEPRCFRQLARMVDACGLSNRVTCHPVGLSDRTGPARITREFHSALTRVTSDPTGAEARVVRLDELAIPDPDLVKIDVEGHEAAVLRGAARCLARAKPLLVLESRYSEDSIEQMLEPLRWLRDAGYDLYQLAWCEEIEGSTVLRRSIGRSRPATLCLLPLPLEERPLIPSALDLVASHPDRRSLLVGL